MNRAGMFLRVGLLTTALAPGFALAQVPGGAGPKTESTAPQFQGKARMSAGDVNFMNDVAAANAAEIRLGKLAVERGVSPAVQQYGQRMVDDHTKLDAELASIAAQRQVSLPQALKSSDQRELDELSKLKGAQFDKAYIQAMVDDHTKDITEFKRAQSTIRDPQLQGFVAKALPILEEHLKMAQQDWQALGQG